MVSVLEQEVNQVASLRDLLAAAQLACDHWGDSQEARRAMRADCLATPPHLRADLIQHFQENYQ